MANYYEAVNSAKFLIGGAEGENPEYERGMFELIMMMHGFNSDDLEQIKKDVYESKGD